MRIRVGDVIRYPNGKDGNELDYKEGVVINIFDPFFTFVHEHVSTVGLIEKIISKIGHVTIRDRQ